MMTYINLPSFTNRHCGIALRCFFMCRIILSILFLFTISSSALAQSPASATSTVTIILPPKLVADQSATLAVLGVDGRLAEGVTVDLGVHSGNEERVTTDKTGRAVFQVPANASVLIAKASGASTAALIDRAQSPSVSQNISIAPVISQQDEFSICGGVFLGDADANRVTLNGDPALALAASPECVVILPGPRVIPGPAKISMESNTTEWTGTTTLVALHFDPPLPPLAPEKKSKLTVHVQGSDQPLNILVENKTPSVLRFLRGNVQELHTSGGAQNLASIEVQTISSGDFSFHARLIPAPDAESGRRYLEAALPLAPETLQNNVKKMASRLAQHPHDTKKILAELDGILSTMTAGDFRALLDAARASLE
jgi:hypothetical protein